MPVTLNPGAYENLKFSFLLKPLAFAAKLWGREVVHSRPQDHPVLLVGKNDMSFGKWHIKQSSGRTKFLWNEGSPVQNSKDIREASGCVVISYPDLPRSYGRQIW